MHDSWLLCFLLGSKYNELKITLNLVPGLFPWRFGTDGNEVDLHLKYSYYSWGVYKTQRRRSILERGGLRLSQKYSAGFHIWSNFLFSEQFLDRRLPKILRLLFEGHTNVSDHFWTFPKINEVSRRLPRKFWRCLNSITRQNIFTNQF